ncbi:MAG: hypothetical protein N2652_10515 [Kiritimatiellae bacterium]|nr:hypothetical protein [Kiritimatiellia bacterium]
MLYRPYLPAASLAVLVAAGRLATQAAIQPTPRVTRLQFGGPDEVVTNRDARGRVTVEVHGDEIVDLAAAPGAALWLVGRLQNSDAAPSASKTTRHGDLRGPCTFAMKIRADLSAVDAVALWPTGVFVVSRCAALPDGGAILAGWLGPEGAERWPSAKSEKTRTALLRLSPAGDRVLWAIAGGPNQSEITGLAITPDGRNFCWTAGTVGRGMGAYVIRGDVESGRTLPFEGTGEWAIGLHPDANWLNQPGQYMAFYQKGRSSPFDYDGPEGWAPVRFWPHGFRSDGHVAVLPDGDLVLAHTMQYDFQIQGAKREPGFDLLVARLARDGRPKWSVNAYQPGDSVHTPDQKAQDIRLNPVTGEILVAAWQHGSNVYRLIGDLIGDSGNISVPWIGRFDAATGRVLAGWYFHCIRERGEFDAQGRPQRWPKLSGARIARLAVDHTGRIWAAATGGRYAFTTPDAAQAWPRGADGQPLWGQFGVLLALSPDLARLEYATLVRGNAADRGDGNAAGGSELNAITTAENAILAGGYVGDDGFPTEDAPQWSRKVSGDRRDCALVRVVLEQR